MMTVINDILDFSKIEARKLELVSVNFDLRDCVGEATKTLGSGAYQKGLEIAFDVAPNVPDVVSGDPIRLRQVLLNLIGNAVKFTAKGEITVRVESEAETNGQTTLHFQVIDTGMGIPKAKQALIFEAFAQADGSSTRHFGGTGLGLSISEKLVKMMGGRIWVESEPGVGSTFHFTVRLGRAHEPLDKPGPSIEQQEELRGLRVLVVDDNRTNQFIFGRILDNWGMRATVAGGGQEALGILNTQRAFDLILLDYHMPGMDGIELAQQIRQNPRFATATILMLSSGGGPEEAVRARQSGIAICLFKPFKQSELLAAIQKSLGTGSRQDVPKSPRIVSGPRQVTPMLRILLAEDNSVNQIVATRLLEKRGHTVVAVGNGREAVSAVGTQIFDLALVDLQMPEMDGLQAVSLIRQREETMGKPRLPIIALTAHAMRGDRERCLAAGMDGYITKPINKTELLSTIDSVVQNSPPVGSTISPPPPETIPDRRSPGPTN